MKKLLFTIAVVAVMGMSTAKANILPQIKDTDGGTKVSLFIPGFLIKTSSLFIDKNEDPQLKYMLKRMRGVQILVREGSFYKTGYDKRFAKIKKRMERRKFDELLSVRSEDANVQISIKEKRNKIKELVILVDEEETFVCVRLKGNFDLTKVKKYFDNNKVKDADDLKMQIASIN